MEAIERLEEIIKELATIRELIRQVAYRIPIEAEQERTLLISKGNIARHIQPVIADLGNRDSVRSNLIKLLRQIVSLNQLANMADMELRTIEKSLHRQQLFLYKWLGELRA
ncbi:MAG: hypothetical protein N3A72_04415 [bacterium]|nr:hypothetical protein [bacterium]